MTDPLHSPDVKDITAGDKITKDDIRAKLDELTTTVEAPLVDARDTAKKAGVGILVVVVVVAFLYGRRRGRKRRTIVEIKRV